MTLHHRLGKQVGGRAATGRTMSASAIDGGVRCPVSGSVSRGSEFIFPNRTGRGRRGQVTGSLSETFGMADTRSMM